MTALLIVAVLVLVLVNGFFVAAEFALVKVRSSQLDSLADEGNRRAELSRHITGHLDAYLSAEAKKWGQVVVQTGAKVD